MSSARREPLADEPFRLLVLADFSGRAGREAPATGAALARRRRVLVDRDDLDAAIATLDPRVVVPLPRGGAAALRFRRLDDFRPENIFETSAAFAPLRDLWARLLDRTTFAEAAAQVRSWGDVSPARSPGASHADESSRTTEPAPAGVPGSADLLAEMLAETGRRAAEGGGDEYEAMVRDIAAPGVAKLRVAPTDPEQVALVGRVRAEIASLLRAVLHHPAFQALEARWRGVDLLVRRVETGPDLTIELWDVTRDELVADAGVTGPLSDTALHRVLAEEPLSVPGGHPWGLVVGDYAFEANARDVAALLRIARVAEAAGAPFVAGGDGRIVGCRSLGDTPDPDEWRHEGEPLGRELWRALRRVPEASRLALVWPRVLLRRPYGRETDPAPSLDFEELGDPPRHDDLAWGNGAFVAALVVANGFRAAGWSLRDALDPDVGDLPVVLREVDGEREIVPCAETLLTSRGGQRISSAGLIPLLSVRGEGAVRLGSLDSLADPASPLRGRWA